MKHAKLEKLSLDVRRNVIESEIIKRQFQEIAKISARTVRRLVTCKKKRTK